MMSTANIWAARSTCSRLRVGVVIAKESRILVQGYNGAPAGMPHCDHACQCFGIPNEEAIYRAPEDHRGDCAMINPCEVSVHAEANAIAWAARHGIALVGAQLYTTHMPCLACAKLIINAGLLSVTFRDSYRDESGIRLLRDAFIAVDKYDKVSS